MYNFGPYPLKRWGSVTTRPRRLVIGAFTAATSAAPAAVERVVSIEHGDIFSGAAATLQAFVIGFGSFLCSFARPAGGLLARSFNAVAALAAVVSFFCTSQVFLHSSAAVAFVCLFSSFWWLFASLSYVHCVFSAALASLLASWHSWYYFLYYWIGVLP
jgi:hypothetical protein